MNKEKILIIDSVYAPCKKNLILNGVQKFSRAQREVLSEHYDVYYLTMKGSDIVYPNQIVLSEIHNVNLSKQDKVKLTKKIAKEIAQILNQVNPDIVLDNSCKHLSSIYSLYKRGVVFEHYHKSSTPLTPKVKEKFEKRKVYWCGVSNWQNGQFRNYFDGVTSVHLVEKQEEVQEAKPYAIFVGRWDRGKKPHVAMNLFAKNEKDLDLHVFTTLNYSYNNKKDLEIIEKLKKHNNIHFHFDAPREEILKYMQNATFILGGGNESTGIVSIEGATYGVPYMVIGTNSVAEQEHMHPFSLFLLNRNSLHTLADQYKAAADRFKNYSLEDRKRIAEYTFINYNKDKFLLNQLKLLNDAKQKYAL
jgi:glycosyltransferase involved in cell wall biosynthesis